MLVGMLASACAPTVQPAQAPVGESLALAAPGVEEAVEAIFTPLPERPNYQPGELVDYIAQTGDTLPALVVRFNTTVAEILAANSFIPQSATTLPPGMPMQIPIYYLPYWGSQFQILPDSLFVNGPAQVGFDTTAFVSGYPGWLNGYTEYAGDKSRSAAEIVDLVALNYSLSPRLLLALLEYQSGGLSRAATPQELSYPLGYVSRLQRGLYLQLIRAADLLNDGYYRWRAGRFPPIEHTNGRIERPDPWQNAATVALQGYFADLYDQPDYNRAIAADGFASAYQSLFGDPWQALQAHIPGSLTQPGLALPFEYRKAWAFTGGPHTGWGTKQPWAAIDFAPPSVVGGCSESSEWVTAMAAGVVARSETGIVELDLDGDSDLRTGWVILYLHLATQDRAALGTQVETRQPVGHPSCEGGRATGTHVHIARKYNGEWILAAGPLAFNLDGWVAYEGSAAYLGSLKRFERVVQASDKSGQASQVQAEEP